MTHKILFVTLGDPQSLNVDLVCQSWNSSPTWEHLIKCSAVVFVGNKAIFKNQSENVGQQMFQNMLDVQNPIDFWGKTGLFFYDVASHHPEGSLEERSFLSTESLRLLQDFIPPQCDDTICVLTMPVDKNICAKRWPNFRGQTECFEKWWAGNCVMTLHGAKFTTGLVTNHLPLKDVASRINSDLIFEKLMIFAKNLPKLLNVDPLKIAVCGLNPHAGDGGLLGFEEETMIKPAIQKAQSLLSPRVQISGPHPGDTVFAQAVRGNFHGVLAMYHDQGLAPFKTLHDLGGVNISLGLKHFRISPDHGPGRDLFLRKKKGDPESLNCCLQVIGSFIKTSKRYEREDEKKLTL